MSTADWIVIALGISAIAWVNWYFFLAESRAERSASTDRRGGGTDDDHRESRHD